MCVAGNVSAPGGAFLHLEPAVNPRIDGGAASLDWDDEETQSRFLDATVPSLVKTTEAKPLTRLKKRSCLTWRDASSRRNCRSRSRRRCRRIRNLMQNTAAGWHH